MYTDYVQFDVNEMYCFIRVLFANGLAPKPDITKWYKLELTAYDELLGNNFIAPLMTIDQVGEILCHVACFCTPNILNLGRYKQPSYRYMWEMYWL